MKRRVLIRRFLMVLTGVSVIGWLVFVKGTNETTFLDAVGLMVGVLFGIFQVSGFVLKLDISAGLAGVIGDNESTLVRFVFATLGGAALTSCLYLMFTNF
ncbi:hypothetical protein [Salinisphaera sp.]|jgi:hypothetical protein|uniref:hypothetical protein n=1 Tax=Salinisphaera sp. TaxID=1914330 RepID=UPI0025D6B546|nr:hypothetical protein [Salinisphaera sp.]